MANLPPPVDTNGNLPPAANLLPVSLTTVANLPPVSTTQAELVAKICRQCRCCWWQIFRWCRWYRGQLAPSINDTGGAPWLANISMNFRKIWNDPTVIFRGLGKGNSVKKNRKQKISWHCPFMSSYYNKFCSLIMHSLCCWAMVFPLTGWRKRWRTMQSSGYQNSTFYPTDISAG